MASAAFTKARLPLAVLASATGLYAYHKRPVLAEQSVTSPSTPSLWTPPSRDELVQALKANKVLPAAKADVSSARFDAIAIDQDPNELNAEPGYDLLIIGGGATGSGVALDAASRGLKVALVDRNDFASGTSSKSTKLVHGGVRYLQKAILELDYEQWKLVKEALRERKTFLHIAPHLSSHLPIMLPVYTWWKLPYYWIGCKMYDFVAGGENMESSYIMSKGKSLQQFPMLKSDGLVGSIVYYDGQHNDSRMNISLIMTAIHYGAVALNHTEVVEILKETDAAGKERAVGAVVKDRFTGESWKVKSKGVINATGPFSDQIRKLDDPTTSAIVAPSSGVHITLPNYFSPGSMGLLDPATSDGRVIFFLPWQGNAIAGTTDVAQTDVPQDPLPKEEEIQWILGEVRNYLSPDIKVRRGDVLSAWSGLRPLVRNPKAANSEALVRNHLITFSDSGLLTIAGGKWTTYRAMAEETVDAAIKEYGLKPKGPCVTHQLRLLGSHGWYPTLFVSLIQQFGLETDVAKHLSENYGALAWVVGSMAEPTGQRWPVHGVRIDPAYPYIEAEVRYAVSRELAATATDVIARRTRLAFLNAQAALEALPRVIEIMASELGWNHTRCQKEFEDAKAYLASMGLPDDLQSLTLKQLQRGDSHKFAFGHQQNSRAIFSHDEIEALQATFAQMDRDKDGKIGEADLEHAMIAAGYQDVTKDKVHQVFSSLPTAQRGQVEFSQFLNAAAGFKELQLDSAFGKVAQGVSKRTQGQKIPVERSGGGA